MTCPKCWIPAITDYIGFYENIIPDNVCDKIMAHDWGMRKNDIDFIVEKSFTKGRMENNIVNLNESNVKEILEKIFFLYD